MSIIDPLTCCYAKVFAYELFTDNNHGVVKLDIENQNKYQSRVSKWKYEEFRKRFKESNLEINTFKRNFPSIKEHFKLLGKKSALDKKHILTELSKQKWNELDIKEQNSHTLFDCKYCTSHYKHMASKFPVKKSVYKIKAAKAGLLVNKDQLKDITNKKINELDTEFKEKYNASFTKIATNILGGNKENKTAEKIKIVREAKKDIERQWKETAVDRVLGLSLSFRKRNQLRQHQALESEEDAIKRKNQNDLKLQQGRKRKIDHVGNLESYEWRKSDCLEAIENLAEGSILNFSELARTYGVKNKTGKTPKNAGQIMKELLVKSSVDICKYKSPYGVQLTENEGFIIRRKKRRFNIPCCSKVSLPIEQTNAEVMEDLLKNIDQGLYSMGDLIVPQTYTKISLKDNKLTNEVISIQGRKIPLRYLRQKLLNKHEKYMRLRTDNDFDKMTPVELLAELQKIKENVDVNSSKQHLLEEIKKLERTRHFMFWHDGSTLSNHSHIMMTVSVIFNKAVFYSDQEYFEKTKEKLNIQSIIEKPELYILARCPSTDQQILYANDRVLDILLLEEDIETSTQITVKDVMRIFKGDSPARQFEAGQQKGGNYPCTACSLPSTLISSYTHSYKLPHMSLDDRILNLRKSSTTNQKINAKALKTFYNLPKTDIMNELHERNVKFKSTMTTKNLQEILSFEMHGMQRLPTLMFDHHTKTSTELRLNTYEVLCNEPLHDIHNHIKNLYFELPSHFDKKDEKQNFQLTLDNSFNDKDAKNSSDYRKSLLIICLWLLENKPSHFITDIFLTLSQIQEILYSPEEERTCKKILRLNNLIFTHSMILKINLKNNLKVLTERKFFGIYYHSLVRHSSQQYRIISGRAANTEKEEALFTKLKDDTKLTSNFHPENVVSNAVIRSQVRKKFHKPKKKTESYIHNLYLQIKNQHKNTIIPFKWLIEWPHEYQTLLQQQADFILEQNIWWNEVAEGIEFNDISNSSCTDQSKLKAHHFYSYTVKDEEKYLNLCWEKCLHVNNIIPAYKIYRYNKDGDKVTEYLQSLKRFDSMERNKITENSSYLSLPNENQSLINDTDLSSFREPYSSSSNLSALNLTNINKIPTDLPILFDNSNLTNESNSNIDTVIIHSTPGKSVNDQEKIISTSTPITAKSKEKEIILDFVRIKNNENIPTTNSKTNLSNSSKKLIYVLGENELIIKYDKIRKEMKDKNKKYNTFRKTEYNKITAALEVKLTIKKDELKQKLQRLEYGTMKENKSTDVVPNNETNKKEYDKYLKKLQYIESLMMEIVVL